MVKLTHLISLLILLSLVGFVIACGGQESQVEEEADTIENADTTESVDSIEKANKSMDADEIENNNSIGSENAHFSDDPSGASAQEHMDEAQITMENTEVVMVAEPDSYDPSTSTPEQRLAGLWTGTADNEMEFMLDLSGSMNFKFTAKDPSSGSTQVLTGVWEVAEDLILYGEELDGTPLEFANNLGGVYEFETHSQFQWEFYWNDQDYNVIFNRY